MAGVGDSKPLLPLWPVRPSDRTGERREPPKRKPGQVPSRKDEQADGEANEPAEKGFDDYA